LHKARHYVPSSEDIVSTRQSEQVPSSAAICPAAQPPLTIGIHSYPLREGVVSAAQSRQVPSINVAYLFVQTMFSTHNVPSSEDLEPAGQISQVKSANVMCPAGQLLKAVKIGLHAFPAAVGVLKSSQF